MADPVSGLQIPITAKNDTEKGAKAAEKRLSQVAKRAGEVSRKSQNDNERRIGTSTKAIIGSFTKIEAAAAKALGGRSLTSGVSGRLSALTEAASALGDGLSGAASASGVLSSAVGMIGATATAAVAGVVALAYAGYKLADAWAKSASQIGRASDIMGVGSKTLQEFSAAAERVGVDKGASSGALGGLSQTLNDARYGRNTGALAALSRLHVGMQLNKDGTVNIDAMLPTIASAITRQNSSGRRRAAQLLGIPEAALPAFTMGGKALSAMMKDTEKTAPLASTKDISDAERFVSKQVRVSQLAAKGQMYLGRKAATTVGEPVLDGILKGENALNDIGETWQKATDTFSNAVDKFGDYIFGPRIGSSSMRAGDVGSHAANAARFRDMLMNQYGVSKSDATMLAANGELESGLDPHSIEKGGGAGRGIWQLTDPGRKAMFKQVTGKDIEDAVRDGDAASQIKYQLWELKHSEAKHYAQIQRLPDNSAERSAAYGTLIERPADKEKRAYDAALVGGAMDRIPVHITMEGKNLPPGMKVTATTPRGAISHYDDNQN